MADIRVIPAALLILPAFLSVRPAKQRISGIVVSTLVVLNAGYAAYVWLSYQSDYAEMKTSFALLRPASFVLVAGSGVFGHGNIRENAAKLLAAARSAALVRT